MVGLELGDGSVAKYGKTGSVESETLVALSEGMEEPACDNGMGNPGPVGGIENRRHGAGLNEPACDSEMDIPNELDGIEDFLSEFESDLMEEGEDLEAWLQPGDLENWHDEDMVCRGGRGDVVCIDSCCWRCFFTFCSDVFLLEASFFVIYYIYICGVRLDVGREVSLYLSSME